MSEVEDLSTLADYQLTLQLEQSQWNTSDWMHPNFVTTAPLRSSSNSPVGSSHGDSNDSTSSQESDEEPVEEERDIDSNSVDNEYIRHILQLADLHILQPSLVNNAYNGEDRERNLFHLFFTRNYLETVCRWTAEDLRSKGKKPCSVPEFFAYIGLELGMSLLKYNNIKSYWSKGCFIGHDTFRDTMSRTRFQNIRASTRFTSIQAYDNEMATTDPLWSCRSFLDHFIRKSASVAVPVGVSALDENSCATKARSKAKTYSPNKPAKYAIRFYAVVGHQYCYLSSMFDNHAGNTTGIEGVHNYCRLFRTLRAPYFKVIGNDKSKDSLADTPSALWVLMMAHQTANYKQPSGSKRYFFCDNYYTRHRLASVLHEFTDGEAYMIGTVKFTNVDATNRYYLAQAIELMKDKNRGSWCLVQAYNKHHDYDRLRNLHGSQQRRQSTSTRAPFIPPLDSPADRAGFIVFKDSKVVIFYTNDLRENPAEPILDGCDDRAIKCVHGLAKISRWTGTEVLHRTDFFVAAPIVAYNMFMNGVDRMDQYRATLATQRREKRIHMTLFTFCLDLAITQAYAVFQKVAKQKGHKIDSFFVFKRKLCGSLIAPQQRQQRNAAATPEEDLSIDHEPSIINGRVTIASSLGALDTSHMIVENLPRRTRLHQPQDIDCYLCRKMGKELKTIYSCIQCKKGFHVNCFTAYHYRGVLSTSHKALLDVVFNSDKQPTMGKPSSYAPTSTAHMKLPAEKESSYIKALVRTKANKRVNEERKKSNADMRKQRKLDQQNHSATECN